MAVRLYFPFRQKAMYPAQPAWVKWVDSHPSIIQSPGMSVACYDPNHPFPHNPMLHCPIVCLASTCPHSHNINATFAFELHLLFTLAFSPLPNPRLQPRALRIGSWHADSFLHPSSMSKHNSPCLSILTGHSHAAAAMCPGPDTASTHYIQVVVKLGRHHEQSYPGKGKKRRVLPHNGDWVFWGGGNLCPPPSSAFLQALFVDPNGRAMHYSTSLTTNREFASSQWLSRRCWHVRHCVFVPEILVLSFTSLLQRGNHDAGSFRNSGPRIPEPSIQNNPGLEIFTLETSLLERNTVIHYRSALLPTHHNPLKLPILANRLLMTLDETESRKTMMHTRQQTQSLIVIDAVLSWLFRAHSNCDLDTSLPFAANLAYKTDSICLDGPNKTLLLRTGFIQIPRYPQAFIIARSPIASRLLCNCVGVSRPPAVTSPTTQRASFNCPFIADSLQEHVMPFPPRSRPACQARLQRILPMGANRLGRIQATVPKNLAIIHVRAAARMISIQPISTPVSIYLLPESLSHHSTVASACRHSTILHS
ncbi:uncharacterized protein CLUP02_05545 [Colletotrichum lupini]|uniref:Uncharacterized protein n=1 Tax=Colletotrichum lupini TaxID=145971 RepID=A0A9Q8WDT5_9PEZI|nr:uncharacterized protein CLUP02_05545 [Colletotrichum lupini]UQC80063.1 hypothetical protein CLUP02_05545 [Colletotrichum lupini]